jgi:NNP family nitrate/nitrite transporter-like MFS transporter
MGSVGGMVGVIGGLGGFSLPIIFGIASDLLNVRSSCFMVLYGLVIACMFFMHFAIKHLEEKKGIIADQSISG